MDYKNMTKTGVIMLSNNLSFYILQIFKRLNILGVRFVLQNIFSSLRGKVKKLIKNYIKTKYIITEVIK